MLKRATDITLAMETATRNTATLQGAGDERDYGKLAVHQVQPRAPPLHPIGLSLRQRLEHATGVGGGWIILPPSMDTKIPNASTAGRLDILPECVGAGTSRVPSSHSP